MPVCDKASWRLKPESQLPDIFTREVNECEDLLVAVRDKMKTQKVNENLEFFKRATRASMIISQCYRRYLFQTKIRHRVYVSKISKIQNRWRYRQARKRFQFIKAALIIQRNIRIYLARTFTRRLRLGKTEAAKCIQRYIRGYLARRYAKTLLPFHERILKYHNDRMAALTLQRAMKNFLARVKGRRLLLLHKAAALKNDKGKQKRASKEKKKSQEIEELLDSYNSIRNKKSKKKSQPEKKVTDESIKKLVMHEHVATVGACLLDIAHIFESKAKQDVLDRKHGHSHPHFAYIVLDYFENKYGMKMGHEKHKLFLDALVEFASANTRLRWFAICLGQNTYTKKEILINTSTKMIDKCFFPYRKKAIQVYTKALFAMIPPEKVAQTFREDHTKVTLNKGKVAIRRAFNENEDITMAQIQEKLIASVEAELDEDEIALEYSTSVDADSILDMCMRQWYALQLVNFLNPLPPDEEASTSLHIEYTEKKKNLCWKNKLCSHCGMVHMTLEDRDQDVTSSENKAEANWDIPLEVERWSFQDFEPTIHHGTGINHERISFYAHRKAARAVIEGYMAGEEIIATSPVTLRHEKL